MGCGYPWSSIWRVNDCACPADTTSTSLEEHQGLRSYRWNLNSAHTCVGKPSSVVVLSYAPTGATHVSLTSHFFPAQNQLGYKQQLHRSWHLVESFAASFVALNFIGGVRRAPQDCAFPWLARWWPCGSMVILPYHHGFHVHHGRGIGGNLLCLAFEWFHLYLGCGERWA